MNLLAIILSLFLALLLEELLSWSPWLSDKVIRFSVQMLPPEHRERYKEEFQSVLHLVNGRLCKLIRSIEFIWVAWQVRNELYMVYGGTFAYQVIDDNHDIFYTGTCSLRSSLFGHFFVTGRLLKIITTRDSDPHVREVSIPWKSYNVSLRQGKLFVRYAIKIDGEFINGQYEISFERQSFSGVLDRSPIEQGLFLLRKRPTEPIWSILLAHTMFLWDSCLQKLRSVKR